MISLLLKASRHEMNLFWCRDGEITHNIENCFLIVSHEILVEDCIWTNTMGSKVSLPSYIMCLKLTYHEVMLLKREDWFPYCLWYKFIGHEPVICLPGFGMRLGLADFVTPPYRLRGNFVQHVLKLVLL